jgi:arylsulfatase A-like enzyme
MMPFPRDCIKEIKENPKALQTLVDRYDSEINYCDRHIKDLFDLLLPDENTLIVITADHGEAFLDHGQLLHGDTLFEEEIRVPLIVKLPGMGHTKKTIPLPLSNRHIFRTIMDIAGLEKTKKIPGKSLMPLISEATTDISRHLYFELDWSGYSKAIRVENWKLVVSGRGRKEHLLFDLRSDPGEARNLVEKMPGKAKELEALLKHWIKTNPEFKAPKIRVALDKEHENKLRTLGYL